VDGPERAGDRPLERREMDQTLAKAGGAKKAEPRADGAERLQIFVTPRTRMREEGGRRGVGGCFGPMRDLVDQDFDTVVDWDEFVLHAARSPIVALEQPTSS
jgi:hypothetical protein